VELGTWPGPVTKIRYRWVCESPFDLLLNLGTRPTGFYGHLGVGMRKPHAILGSHGREMCVATMATGPGAGLFGTRLRSIEWKTLFCRKHSRGNIYPI
jgi:hypothetical protein